MAAFRTHTTFGTALGILSVIGLVFTALNSGSGFLVAVFTMALLGSILPDLDSDSGTPFHAVFGSLSLVMGTLTFIELLKNSINDPLGMLLKVLGVVIFVWCVLGTVFKRFTRHRGMAHSIPAALLSALIANMVAMRFSFTEQESFLLGIVIMAGYLVHLILDELYATIHFDGTPFKPKHSLGTALKLSSRSIPMNITIYTTIIFLIVGNGSRYYELARTLLRRIT
ncbi:MAG: hypothetical protein HGA31_02315 [Candidatus Moranbacteria bacterium]|nr:hypothetical protein [Candidatus Moranbacteria bacterium]